MKQISSFLWLVIACGVLLHGYFFVAYGTLHPCHVAVVKAFQDKGPFMELNIQMQLGVYPPILKCYQFAIFGGDAQALLVK